MKNTTADTALKQVGFLFHGMIIGIFCLWPFMIEASTASLINSGIVQNTADQPVRIIQPSEIICRCCQVTSVDQQVHRHAQGGRQ